MNDKPLKPFEWQGFVSTDVVNFMNLYGLEKMTLEDGKGNKAKLAIQKDNIIKVQYSSISLL